MGKILDPSLLPMAVPSVFECLNVAYVKELGGVNDQNSAV